MRIAGSGSAPIPGELLTWYRKLGLELLEGYGMSENFNYSHVSRPGQVRVGYVGSPHEGVECKLGAGGEILVKSPGSMLGYFKQPNETREAFTEDGFLKTGDCGVIDELSAIGQYPLSTTRRLEAQAGADASHHAWCSGMDGFPDNAGGRKRILVHDRLTASAAGFFRQCGFH